LSAAVKLTVTMPGLDVVSTEPGVKLKALNVGGVESLTEVTATKLGNPAALSAALFRLVVLPTASASKIPAIVQVPVSVNCGKVTVAEPLTLFAGDTLAVPDNWIAPDGLANPT
jgi:hypothetical protein